MTDGVTKNFCWN